MLETLLACMTSTVKWFNPFISQALICGNDHLLLQSMKFSFYSESNKFACTPKYAGQSRVRFFWHVQKGAGLGLTRL